MIKRLGSLLRRRPKRNPAPWIPMADKPEPQSAQRFAASQDPQLSCSLFTVLPSELRNLIFRIALTEYDDVSRPYDKHAHYYRPGYRFHGLIDTALLLTCQRIYLETRFVAITTNEHVFWVHFPQRAPPEFKKFNYRGPPIYFQPFSSEHKAAVRRIHLFTPQVWLERTAQFAMPVRGVDPRELVITIRHTDWWYWETNEKLVIDPTRHGRGRVVGVVAPPSMELRMRPWGMWFSRMPGLERLVLELETIEQNNAQLDEIVERQAKEWRFELHKDENGARAFSNEALKIERFRWVGTSRFKGALYDVRAAESLALIANGTEAKNTGRPAEEIQELEGFDPAGADADGDIPYYIVRLTWDAHRATSSGT